MTSFTFCCYTIVNSSRFLDLYGLQGDTEYNYLLFETTCWVFIVQVQNNEQGNTAFVLAFFIWVTTLDGNGARHANHQEIFIFRNIILFWWPGSSAVTATDCWLDGPGVESRWGIIFRRPYIWGPPSLLYNGYRVFPRGRKRPGRDADPSPRSSAEV